MMVNSENKNGLKGQHNLAQGKRRRSVALGIRASEKIVRKIALIKGQILFRTKKMNSISKAIKWLNSVRNKFIVLIVIFSRTVFLALHFYPGRRFGSFLPKLFPGLNYIGLSGQEKPH